MSQLEAIKKYQELIAECDRLIKAGKMGAVSLLISDMKLSQVPRSEREALAKICRRAGLISQGLRLLQPIIRRQAEWGGEEPTSGEICEYAVLLSRNGSLREAMGLLEKVNPLKTPEANLYLGYCHISNWDYAKAASFLESFLDSEADSYSKLIASVNLAASYVSTAQFSEAENLLNESIAVAESSGASRLVGNCLLLRGQIHFRKEQFSNSRKDLEQAQRIFGQNSTYDQLLIRKWLTIMSAIEEKSVGPLLQFRQEAWRRRHWESVRESDLFTVKIRFDQNLLDHLILGTPMPAYRQRIQQEVGALPSSSFVFGSSAGPCLDLRTGCFAHGGELNPGKKIHHVIAALMRDFYLPQNMGTLFSELYPDESFDIYSSPLRVRQLLHRTRRWIEESKLPVVIRHHRNTYRLLIVGDFGIQVPLLSEGLDSNALRWEEIKRHFPAGVPFAAEDVCRKFNWSRSNFHRFIQWAIESGFLQKTGVNRATRYQVPSPSDRGPIKKVA